MSQPTKSRGTWEIFKSVILLFTPVLVAIMGYFFNKSLTNIEGKIANVTAMQPFMEMIASEDVTKSKMGAYAIYMLKREDDPEIAAQMILAPGKQHLLDVLMDIGKRDSVVYGVVQNVLLDLNTRGVDGDSTNLSEIQKNAIKIINRIDEAESFQENASISAKELNEWLYLGNRNESQKTWTANAMPSKSNIGKPLTLIKDANVRKGKPQPPNYKLPNFVRVAREGTKVEVDTFTIDRKGNCWARVMFE